MGCDHNPFNHNTDFAAEENFSFDLAIDSQSRLRLEGVAGTIFITGAPESDAVKITGQKRVESSSFEDAEEHLKELEVNVQKLTNEISIKTIQPSNTHGRQYLVNYTITLPQDFEVVAGNVSGEITIQSIYDSVKVINVSGNAKLLETSGSAYVETVSGNIEARITSLRDGTIDLRAVSGNIALAIPQNTSMELSATAVSGHISVSNLVLENVVQTANSLRGKCGDGRGTVSLTTVSGNINVKGF
jgi:DUF4097 and DUF4098 domain-containing protein YvlB